MIEVRAMQKKVAANLESPGNCFCGCVWNSDWTADYSAFEAGGSCGCGCPEDMVKNLAWMVAIV